MTFDGSPREPFFKVRHSSSAITDIAEPQLISIPAFFRITGLDQDRFGAYIASGQLRLKTIDETTFIDLNSPLAKQLLSDGRQRI